jgi:uncharacterized membrane protein YkoI
MKTLTSIFLLCLTLLPAVALPAAVESVQPQNLLPPSERNAERNANLDPEREPRISQNRASDIVRENIPGSRVLNIRPDGQNYRVRVDQDGNVSDVLVNAESGRVSRSDDE